MKRSRIGRVLVVGLIVVLAVTSRAGADPPAHPAVGLRVRLTVPAVSGKRLIGTILKLDDTTLTLKPQGGRQALEVPRNAIALVELSQGRSRRSKSAGIGALVGLATAVVVGVGTGQSCASDAWLCFDRTETTLLLSLLTIPTGTLVGFAVPPSETWRTVSPERLGLSVSRGANGGVRAVASIRF